MTENLLLVWAMLLFVAVIAGKLAYKFGAPSLLLFLGVGMLFGLHLIDFQSFEFTQFVGMVALCIILFSDSTRSEKRYCHNKAKHQCNKTFNHSFLSGNY